MSKALSITSESDWTDHAIYSEFQRRLPPHSRVTAPDWHSELRPLQCSLLPESHCRTRGECRMGIEIKRARTLKSARRHSSPRHYELRKFLHCQLTSRGSLFFFLFRCRNALWGVHSSRAGIIQRAGS